MFGFPLHETKPKQLQPEFDFHFCAINHFYSTENGCQQTNFWDFILWNMIFLLYYDDYYIFNCLYKKINSWYLNFGSGLITHTLVFVVDNFEFWLTCHSVCFHLKYMKNLNRLVTKSILFEILKRGIIHWFIHCYPHLSCYSDNIFAVILTIFICASIILLNIFGISN